jgi:hypothetical protein
MIHIVSILVPVTAKWFLYNVHVILYANITWDGRHEVREPDGSSWQERPRLTQQSSLSGRHFFPWDKHWNVHGTQLLETTDNQFENKQFTRNSHLSIQPPRHLIPPSHPGICHHPATQHLISSRHSATDTTQWWWVYWWDMSVASLYSWGEYWLLNLVYVNILAVLQCRRFSQQVG